MIRVRLQNDFQLQWHRRHRDRRGDSPGSQRSRLTVFSAASTAGLRQRVRKEMMGNTAVTGRLRVISPLNGAGSQELLCFLRSLATTRRRKIIICTHCVTARMVWPKSRAAPPVSLHRFSVRASAMIQISDSSGAMPA